MDRKESAPRLHDAEIKKLFEKARPLTLAELPDAFNAWFGRVYGCKTQSAILGRRR